MLRLRKIVNLISLQQCRQASNLLRLRERGMFPDVFPNESLAKIQSELGNKSRTFYAGFDPTAESLHVGNLLVLIGLIQCQRHGHKPIALLGGATGMIGDPSGRSTERTVMDPAIINANLEAIRSQIQRIFDNHYHLFWKPKSNEKLQRRLEIVNNYDWYSKLNFVEFVSKYGRHFRMGQMLSKVSVQSRLNSEQGMSFTEFTYQIFQAYDWLHLLENYNCHYQIGGSDQMGNIMSGHELISRTARREVFGLTMPLITNEEGNKFGKSAGNAVWLDKNKTSEFGFYQFFVRRSDAEAEKLLNLLSFLPFNEVTNLMEKHQRSPDLRVAQKTLAKDLTLLIHGEEGLKKALKISDALYGGDIQALGDLTPQEVPLLFEGSSYQELHMESGLTMANVGLQIKCFETEADAHRIISAGGFYINQKRAQNPAEILSFDIHVMKNGISLFRVGKKNYYVVRWL